MLMASSIHVAEARDRHPVGTMTVVSPVTVLGAARRHGDDIFAPRAAPVAILRGVTRTRDLEVVIA
jgi:hypothetical protein